MTTPALRFAANLSILYGHLPLLHRPAAAAADGFTAVEMWWPWTNEVPTDQQLDTLIRTFYTGGVHLVALNFIEGDMRAGDRGLLSSPSRAAMFRDGIAPAIYLAEQTGCRILNALYGNREPGADPAQQDAIAMENLCLAATAAHRIGATVVLETISSAEAPGYPLSDADTTVAAADAVNAASGMDNTAFLCDFYHHGRNGEDLTGIMARHAPRIAHVQIADTPGRGRPGSGTLDYPAIFADLTAHHYAGWIGLEYEPTRDPAVDYDWLSTDLVRR